MRQSLSADVPFSPIDEPPLWRLHPLAELHWRGFDPEWVVYEAVSGQTASLNALAAAVLMCFEDRQAWSEAQVREKLAAEFNLDSSLHGQVPDIIEQCRSLNFLVPVTPDAAVRADST